jgi:3-dehydroquinate dehydratase-2
MKNILLIHGPNLNLLGKRDSNHYGKLTLEQLEKLLIAEGEKSGLTIIPFQSNHEGVLIDFLQEHAQESKNCDGIIINPGALTNYSYALHDALIDAKIPTVEVHLSDIENREPWRKVSVIKSACIGQISGKKEQGYFEALELLKKKFSP